MEIKSVSDAPTFERLPGVVHRVLVHNHELMLIHCTLKKGAQVPLHQHRASQLNYILSGRIRFRGEDPEAVYEVGPGESFLVAPDTIHGADVLEDTIYVEAFTPLRPELLEL